MIGRAALRVADGIAERTVMAQVVQIVQDVGAVLVGAAGLALKVGAINAVEMFVFVSKRHGFLLPVKWAICSGEIAVLLVDKAKKRREPPPPIR